METIIYQQDMVFQPKLLIYMKPSRVKSDTQLASSTSAWRGMRRSGAGLESSERILERNIAVCMFIYKICIYVYKMYVHVYICN